MNRTFAKVTAIAVTAATLMTGCGIGNNATLIDINNGKDKITYGYGNFIARVTQAQYDVIYRNYYGDSYWSQNVGSGKTFEKQVKDSVIDTLEEQYVIAAHAKDYKVKISKSEQKKIDKAVKKFMDDNSDEALKQVGATEDYVREMLQNQYYVYKVSEAVEENADTSVSDEEAAQKDISYVRFDTSSATGDELDAVKKQASQLATTTQDQFESLAEELGQTVQTTHYGQYDLNKDNEAPALPRKVLQAAEKLTAEGQISSAVYVKNDGYYVVRMDSLDNPNEANSARYSIAEQKRSDALDKTISQWKKETKFKVDANKWEKVRYHDLFESKAANQDSTANGEGISSGSSSSSSAAASSSSVQE